MTFNISWLTRFFRKISERIQHGPSDNDIQENNSFSRSMKQNRYHAKDIVNMLDRGINKEQFIEHHKPVKDDKTEDEESNNNKKTPEE